MEALQFVNSLQLTLLLLRIFLAREGSLVLWGTSEGSPLLNRTPCSVMSLHPFVVFFFGGGGRVSPFTTPPPPLMKPYINTIALAPLCIKYVCEHILWLYNHLIGTRTYFYKAVISCNVDTNSLHTHFHVPEVLQASIQFLMEEGDIILHVSILSGLLHQNVQDWYWFEVDHLSSIALSYPRRWLFQ